jgi:uncharacterized phage-associated protein
MSGFQIDIEKAKAVVLYIAGQLGETDFHRVFKILYFAEKEHLVNYGRPIVGDTYYAMKNGPVPSFIYDALKYARGNGAYSDSFVSIANAITIKSNFTFVAKENADLDELSKSDIACLDKSIQENKDIEYTALTEKSHDEAWKSADKDDAMNLEIIAKAGGANDEMLKYIEECKDCHNIAFA